MYRITFACSGDEFSNGICQIDVNAGTIEKAQDMFSEVRLSKEFKQEYGNVYKVIGVEELSCEKY